MKKDKTSNFNQAPPSDVSVVNLKDYAYREAGKNSGDISVFRTNIDLIYTGKLLDEDSYKPLSEAEIGKINSEISKINEEVNGLESDVVEYKEEQNRLKVKITELKDLKDQIDLGTIPKESASKKFETFSLSTFIITSFFLLTLTAFIFFFYVAVVYKAIFINTQDIANSLTEGQWGVSILPKWYEISEAISNNPMVILAPFIFFGFGYAIHIFLESKQKLKFLWIALVLAITFVLDYLLANQIHDRINEALDLIGMPQSNKFNDILLVLIMGFVVYIIWSVIFHAWKSEWNKRDVTNRLGKKIREHENSIEEYYKKIANANKALSLKKEKIRTLELNLDGELIPASKILQSLSQFTQGWLNYLTGLSEKEQAVKIPEVEDYLNEFKSARNLNDTTLTRI